MRQLPPWLLASILLAGCATPSTLPPPPLRPPSRGRRGAGPHRLAAVADVDHVTAVLRSGQTQRTATLDHAALAAGTTALPQGFLPSDLVIGALDGTTNTDEIDHFGF